MWGGLRKRRWRGDRIQTGEWKSELRARQRKREAWPQEKSERLKLVERLINFTCTEWTESQLSPCCSHCSSSKQKCQMPGHYPFCRDCNINRGARGAMHHRDFGKVTLTRWRLAKAGSPHIYLLHWKHCTGPDGCLPQPPALLLLLPLNTHMHSPAVYAILRLQQTLCCSAAHFRANTASCHTAQLIILA